LLPPFSRPNISFCNTYNRPTGHKRSQNGDDYKYIVGTFIFNIENIQKQVSPYEQAYFI
jgi:hypothetical protein